MSGRSILSARALLSGLRLDNALAQVRRAIAAKHCPAASVTRHPVSQRHNRMEQMIAKAKPLVAALRGFTNPCHRADRHSDIPFGRRSTRQNRIQGGAPGGSIFIRDARRPTCISRRTTRQPTFLVSKIADRESTHVNSMRRSRGGCCQRDNFAMN